MKIESSAQFTPGAEKIEADNHLDLNAAQQETEHHMEELTPHSLSLLEQWIPEASYTSFAESPETKKQFKVIDIDKIKDDLQPYRYGNGERVYRKRQLQLLFEKHKNDLVLTPEQIAKGDFKPKPLFYYPKTKDDATDSLAIADAEFHVPIWEMAQKMVLAERSNIHPTESGEVLSMFEAKTALYIFHPDYGDGRRNPRDGKLYLKNPDYDENNPDSPKRLKLSRDLLRRYGIRLHVTGNGESQSMREGIENECPNLLKSGALQLDDIREFTISREGAVSEQFDKVVGKNSYVMLRAVNHYVGRRFAGCEVSALGDKKALVIDAGEGYKKIKAIFSIIGKDDASGVYISPDGNTVVRANADKTKPIEINYAKLVPNNYEDKSGVMVDQKRKEVAMRIAQSVELLMDMARESEELVRSEVHATDEETEVLVQQVRTLLLSQAERVITQIASEPSTTSLETTLQSSESTARAFVALLQSAGSEKMIRQPLDEIKAQELSPEQREQMRKILQANYEKAYPGEENILFRKKILESLEAAFTREGTNFTILNDGKKIVSFNRFDTTIEPETNRKVLYFGSFNADPQYRGVGSIMLEQTIQEKLQTCDAMQAHCDPESDISKKYIEDGFVATNTETVAGKFSFEIWRSKDSSLQLKTKNMTQEELITLAGQTMNTDADYFVRVVEPNDQFLELDSGLAYLLTRYFTSGGKTYAVFELNATVGRTFALPESSNT